MLSLREPAAARAETGVPVRKERVRAWFAALGRSAGVLLGVADRGVALDGVEEADELLRSRPVTGGFLAAMVDMMGDCTEGKDGPETGCCLRPDVRQPVAGLKRCKKRVEGETKRSREVARGE